MPYDHGLAERLDPIATEHGLAEKRMFGGVGWLLNGNMCFGVYKDWLMLRVGEENAARLLESAHIKVMDITGKPMKGWLMVAPEGYADDDDIARLTRLAIIFAGHLPAKD